MSTSVQIPSTHTKSQAWLHVPVTPAVEGRGRLKPRNCWSSSLTQTASLGFSVRSCLKAVKWSKREHLRSCYGLFRYMHECMLWTHIHAPHTYKRRYSLRCVTHICNQIGNIWEDEANLRPARSCFKTLKKKKKQKQALGTAQWQTASLAYTRAYVCCRDMKKTHLLHATSFIPSEKQASSEFGPVWSI